jgi:hypothetical protein
MGQGADDCTSASIPALSLGANAGSNVGATTSVGFNTPTCATALNSDVWFTFTPANTGPHQIDTNGPTGAGLLSDTVLQVYSSCATPALACDDDSGNGALSLLNIFLNAGTTYLVQVGDFGGQNSVVQGGFSLNVAFIPPPPANDACANAVLIQEGVIIAGSTLAATTGADPLGNCAPNGKDVWYTFLSSCSGPYTVTTCSTSVYFDQVVTVWGGSCGSLTQIGCDDDSCGFLAGPSAVTFTATAGTFYYVSVAGYGTGTATASGNYHLRVGPGNGTFALSFATGGPGVVGWTLSGGPTIGGMGFTAVTLAQGLYPNDWFFGIAISIPELFTEFTGGYPFTTLLGPCGDAVLGPFGNLPSGLTAYAVALGFPSGASTPTLVSTPQTVTVP